jgi:hypothetical protein
MDASAALGTRLGAPILRQFSAVENYRPYVTRLVIGGGERQ